MPKALTFSTSDKSQCLLALDLSLVLKVNAYFLCQINIILTERHWILSLVTKSMPNCITICVHSWLVYRIQWRILQWYVLNCYGKIDMLSWELRFISYLKVILQIYAAIGTSLSNTTEDFYKERPMKFFIHNNPTHCRS